MPVIVPFDGSALSKTALQHGARASTLYGDTTLAVTVIPSQNASYARENGWISDGEAFDEEAIVERLRDQVTEIAPEAEFEYVLVDKHAPSGTISSRIRRFARDRDASAIFIGSENAGHSILGTTSVGGQVVYEDAYDIAIIRNPLPGFVSVESES